jgi:uncharacterized RDD family membrane protein YckC/Flp pilus assembly protein TadD
MEYASFGKRFWAALIDGVLIFVGVLLAALVLGENPILYLVGVAYYVAMESSSMQATVGKRALGIKVTDMHGNKISAGRALGRNLAKYISALILCIGYIMAAFSKKKQALHDMMASCLVVRDMGEGGAVDEMSSGIRDEKVDLERDIEVLEQELAQSAALQEEPSIDSVPTASPNAEGYFEKGLKLFENGQVEEAIATLRQGQILDPDSFQINYNLGVMLKVQGDLDGALGEYRKALASDPDNYMAQTNIGAILKQQGDLNGALEALQEGLRIKPDDARGHYNLGGILRSLKDMEGALQAFRECERLAGDDRELQEKARRQIKKFT